MDCAEFKVQIPLLLDGALGPAEEADFMQHLEHCRECSQLLEREQHFHNFIRKRLQPVPAPVELRRQVMEQMRRRRAANNWRWPAIASLAAAAAVTAVIIFGAGSGEGPIPGTIRTAIARQSDDRLPLDVQSANEAELQNFFARHLPFAFSLPRITSHSHVRGGRLTYLGEQPTAFISYEINGEKASLYVFTDPTSSAYAEKSGERCKIIKEADNERQAVIWHRGNVVYSLVSNQADQSVSEFVKAGCEQ